MRPLILCHERWQRIEHVLARLGGKAPVRQLERSFAIRAWEIEQSADLGWLTITVRRPRVGRPSRIVEFRDYDFATLPPDRCMIEKRIRFRHWLFAKRSVEEAAYRGMRSPLFTLPGIVSAYLSVYNPQSRRGAYASASRLLRQPAVRAARQWFYARICKEISLDEPMPETVSGIGLRLKELGSWRACFW